MKKDIRLRVLNSRIILLSILVLVPLILFIVFIAEKITNTTNQTYFIITCLSIIAIINFLIVKKSTKLVNFSFSDSSLCISSDTISTKIIYSDINNYNIYY